MKEETNELIRSRRHECILASHCSVVECCFEWNLFVCAYFYNELQSHRYEVVFKGRY